MTRTQFEYPVASLLDGAAASAETTARWNVDLDFPSEKLGRKPLDDDRSQPGGHWVLPEGRVI